MTSLVIMVTGIAVLISCGSLAARIVRHIAPTRHSAPLIARTLVLSCYPLMFWTLRGMEVGVVTMCVLALGLVALRATDERIFRSCRIIALITIVGVLTRLDVAVLVAAVALWTAVHHRGRVRSQLLQGLGFGLCIAIVGQEIFRRWYFGQWLPNTYYLKVANIAASTRFDRGWRVVLFSFVALLACSAVIIAHVPRGTTLGGVSLLMGVATSAALYCVAVGGDAWEWMRFGDRYLVPSIVCFLCCAAIGICDFAQSLVGMRASVRGRTTGIVRGGYYTLIASAALLGSKVFINRTNLGTTKFHSLSDTQIAVIPVCMAGLLWVLTRCQPTVAFARRALAIMIAVSISGPAFDDWLSHNAMYASFDADNVVVGGILQRITTPEGKIAVTVAGGPIYFAHRDGIDLLGKMDPRIARLGIHPGFRFWPGHSKWSTSISLTEEPDVITNLFIEDPASVALIHEAGYVDITVTDQALRDLDAWKFHGIHLYAKHNSRNVLWRFVRTL